MSKIYLIAPCVLLLGFSLFERVARRDHDARIQTVAAERAARELAEVERRETLKNQTLRESSERVRLREEQERARDAARRREHEIALAAVDRETATHRAHVEQLARELDHLHGQLTVLRQEKAAKETAVFDLARDVEQKRIDRRVVEIEIQRTTKVAVKQLIEAEPEL